jgi:membrane protease YdiL (CAAX protease family)
VAFGLIHYLPGAWQDALLLMGVMFVNGIALAWWYERRGTIVSSIVAHMVFNVIGIVLIFGTR